MHENGIECIRELIRLMQAGKLYSLEAAREIGHLWCFIIDVLSAPDDVLKTTADDELIDALWDLASTVDPEFDSDRNAFKGLFGPAVMAMLIEIVIKWLVTQMDNGELARMIQQLFDEWKKKQSQQ